MALYRHCRTALARREPQRVQMNIVPKRYLGDHVTANEVEILPALRVATDDTDPKLMGRRGRRRSKSWRRC